MVFSHLCISVTICGSKNLCGEKEEEQPEGPSLFYSQDSGLLFSINGGARLRRTAVSKHSDL
jgi:hypothetical protein